MNEILQAIEDAAAKLRDAGPMLGAVIAVPWWPDSQASLEITVDEMTYRGWDFLRGIIGKEGVELAQRHKRQKVVIVPAHALRSVPVMAPQATQAWATGTPVYTLKDGPPVCTPEDEPWGWLEIAP